MFQDAEKTLKEMIANLGGIITAEERILGYSKDGRGRQVQISLKVCNDEDEFIAD